MKYVYSFSICEDFVLILCCVSRVLRPPAPPSSPVISAPSTDYPWIATVTRRVNLTCVSAPPGRPAATYSWPVKQGGREETDGQGRGVLTFDTVRKDLHGKSVHCKPSNRYTDNRQSATEGTLTLEVYCELTSSKIIMYDTSSDW